MKIPQIIKTNNNNTDVNDTNKRLPKKWLVTYMLDTEMPTPTMVKPQRLYTEIIISEEYPTWEIIRRYIDNRYTLLSICPYPKNN